MNSHSFNFRLEPTMNMETDQEFRNDPEMANHFVANDRKKTSVCAYCGDIFGVSTDRANHEKENHADKGGLISEFFFLWLKISKKCQIIPLSTIFKHPTYS